jgi:hypothetical protein
MKTLKKWYTVFLLVGIFFQQPLAGQNQDWIQLFDGKTLNGWSIHSGFAKYRVEDGAIVGTAVKSTPNTFLCTDEEYGDFILEFEVLLKDPQLNSGVQFRSQIADGEVVHIFKNDKGDPYRVKIPPDRVYGYQVEIATETSASSGGVYDEARRGFFLDRPEKGSKAGKAFKNGTWNQYKIICQGSSIETFINGISCAKFEDSMTHKGIIGLQVHDVGKDTTPYEVRWRNIRIKVL